MGRRENASFLVFHVQNGSMRRRPANPNFAAIDTLRGRAFRVRPGVSSFKPRRHRWNLGGLPPPASRASGISAHEGSHQCVAPVMLYPKHVLSVAVNGEGRVLLNGQTAFGIKRQELCECLPVKNFWRPRYAEHGVPGGMLASRRTNSSLGAQQLGEAELTVDMTRRLTSYRIWMTVLVFFFRFGLLLSSIFLWIDRTRPEVTGGRQPVTAQAVVSRIIH